ncbi:MAG: glycosyltransferase [Gemmatimonadota bacterium]
MPNILLVSRFDEARNSHSALYQRALERLGASVTPLNLEKTGWLGRLTSKDLNGRMENAILHAAPDLVIVTDGEVLREGAVDELRRLSGAKWIHWFPRPGHDGSLIPQAVKTSDVVFAAGEGTASYWSEHTGGQVRILDPACDPSVHRPLRVREPFKANVVFVGAASPYREGILSQLIEFGLAVWGPGWKKTSLREYCRGEQLSAENFVRAYAGATIAINIHRQGEGPPPDGSVNARLFEIAAIGVVQAVDARRELRRHLVPNEEVLTYSGMEELRDKIRYTLTDSTLRDRMSYAARQSVLRRHTYMHRMREILDCVGT